MGNVVRLASVALPGAARAAAPARIRVLLAIVGWIVVWWLLAAGGVVPKLPTPPDQLAAIREQLGTLLESTATTLVRAVGGFAIGGGLGLALPIALGWNRYTGTVLDTVADLSRTVPGIALLPIFLVWFGTGGLTAVALVAAGSFFIVVVIVAEAIRNVDPLYLRASAALGATRRRSYGSVVLPAIVPAIVGGLRVGLAAAVPWAIAGEYLGAQTGLGAILWRSLQYLQIDRMISVALFGAAIVVLTDVVLRSLTRRLTRWVPREES
jgi:ABC-type nitrate/sulfonate/bicarbonate transport system permease component